MTILITGAAGFIGANFVLDWLAQSSEPVINLDKLTYAGNLETLLGDPTKAKEKLGWVPEITLDQMIEGMVAHDLDQARRHALLKQHGYDVSVSVE